MEKKNKVSNSTKIRLKGNKIPLTIYQKSVYLSILNGTMILRSVGKSLKNPISIKNFKRKVFKELEKLTELMNIGKLKEENILASIKSLSRKFHISFGQAQKSINVLLKYHFYLTHNKNDKIKKALHCPLDSKIIKDGLGMRKISLTKIDKKKYLELQQEIQYRCSFRVEFDSRWDEQNLRNAGIFRPASSKY